MNINVLIASLLTIFLLSIAAPAQACLGPSEEFTIFFETLPADLKNETVAKVKIEKISKGLATAKIIRLITTKNDVVKVGDRIILKYPISSCTREAVYGDVGTIVIKGFVNSDDEKNLVAHLYQRRYRDNFLQ